MESPDAASVMACPIVLQAVVGDLQLLVLFPLFPFTYHVTLAKVVGARARIKAKDSKRENSNPFFIIFPLSAPSIKVMRKGKDKPVRNERKYQGQAFL